MPFSSHAHTSNRSTRSPNQLDIMDSTTAPQSNARVRNDDSWVEISSQPSSSSLSSVADEVVTAGLRVEGSPRTRRRRLLRPAMRSSVTIDNGVLSLSHTSSQEEYDESESEPDRVMTSSGEGVPQPIPVFEGSNRRSFRPSQPAHGIPQSSDEDDEDRTAINYPIHDDTCFTPQPNAFSHPPTHRLQEVPASYFAQSGSRSPRNQYPQSGQHLPQNILSPSYNPAQQHEEALRASLSTLLSIGAAARGLSRPNSKPATESKHTINAANTARPRSNRIDPTSLRLVPESALRPPEQREPAKPALRRGSTSSTSSKPQDEVKRKAMIRSKSAERRAVKKARRASSTDDFIVTPTLLTWAVSAGVVVALTALSFSAGYSLGKEAGKLEANGFLTAGTEGGTCAKEVGRSGMGLKRAMARSAVQV
ncbi:hypothetical protein K431DRAFT_281831 [Polychaeton citri CBS 116435]|uniref:Uncharacterized protein n=1 Tax=Polychaeton citri CBS 116435 TaxID=1314669 RepID=A0A9P4QGN2_9PEZI|nr:hypothetical protein K431DRAFT_281831 [Polychaeton citri CBS 116435]